jgi:hypothetical protein
MKKDKMTTNDLQNANQKTKDRTTLTPLKTRLNSGATEGFAGMKKAVYLDIYIYILIVSE